MKDPDTAALVLTLGVNILLISLGYLVNFIFIRYFAKMSWKEAARTSALVAITAYILQLLSLAIVPSVLFVLYKLAYSVSFIVDNLRPIKFLVTPLFELSVPLVILFVTTNICSHIVCSRLKLKFKKVCLWMLGAQITVLAIFGGLMLLVKRCY